MSGQSEKRFRRLVETANEGVWVVDTEFKTTFVNSRMADMLGYTPEEMVGRKLSSLKFEEDLADLYGRQQEVLGAQAKIFEGRYKRKDGTAVLAFISTAPLLNDEGTVEGSFAMITDMTELRKTEQECRDMEKRYQAVVDNARIGISVLNSHMEIVAINKQLKRYFPHARPACG
ncbi:MAG: PAS domain S-box protein, partial [Deltaproteobacteria bacterium]